MISSNAPHIVTAKEHDLVVRLSKFGPELSPSDFRRITSPDTTWAD